MSAAGDRVSEGRPAVGTKGESGTVSSSNVSSQRSRSLSGVKAFVSLQDKRSATKKYKDACTELSVVRAKAEREMGELRENLRLAHRALGHASA